MAYQQIIGGECRMKEQELINKIGEYGKGDV